MLTTADRAKLDVIRARVEALKEPGSSLELPPFELPATPRDGKGEPTTTGGGLIPRLPNSLRLSVMASGTHAGGGEDPRCDGDRGDPYP